MKHKLLILFFCATFTALLSEAANASPMPGIFNGVNRDEMNEWVDSLMSSMTIDEKIGQLFVLQLSPSTDATNTAWVKKMVTRHHIGGLLYNRGTLDEQAQLTNYAQSITKVPLLITLDGEWGLSMRFSDATEYPRNMILGAISDDKLLYEYGLETARQCRRTGIHVNFAPVLDVNDNPSNPVIGTRSFGESPELVARHGIAYAKGLEDGGVLSVAKHFPGHGNSSQDSHKTLPTINKNMSELKTCEFVPFTRYIDAGLSGMLTAHLYVPAIFDEQIPSSLSEKVVTDLLQNEMGFNGLIFTDEEFFITNPNEPGAAPRILPLSGEEKKLLRNLTMPAGNVAPASPMVAKRLRNKLNGVLSDIDIITVRGRGYKLILLTPNEKNTGDQA